MTPTFSASLVSAAPDGLLQTLLHVSLTGVILFRPIYASHDPAALTDLAYVHLNPAAQRMLQLPECPTESFLTLYPNSTKTGVFAFYRDTFEAGTASYYDVNYQHNGLDNYYQLAAQRHSELLVVSFTDTAGQPRTAAEEALLQNQAARAQQQQHEILTQSPASIAAFHGPEHRFSFTNPRYDALVGHRSALGRPMVECFPEAPEQGFLGILDDVYQTGLPFESRETPTTLALADQTGTVSYFLDVSYLPLRDEQGRTTGVLAFILDVTEQVLARRQVEVLNKELHASNAQLTRTNADLDTFVYTASHDLKTPLTNIEGLLTALQQELPPAARQTGAVQPMLDRMEGAVERFRTTIAQLTDVARLQRAQDQPAEEVDLDALVADLRLDLAPLLATTNAQLTLDVASCPQVSFAPQHLRSIVYNLLSNAVKYHHPARPPHVQLRCRCTAERVVLGVEDNGLGLTEAQQGQLFGLFRRLHDHVEGTGVGLYTVKRIVENAGGTITVQSVPGVGSTFTVTLPRAASKGEQEEK